MSDKLEGKSCQICHSYLFEDDDVVYCPVCGAPHHRDCFKSVGHCGVQCNHGTDKQYDKLPDDISEKPPEPSKKTCPNCGKEIDNTTLFCPSCGTEIGKINNAAPNAPPQPFGGMPMGGFAMQQINPLGGVDPGAVIDDVKATEIRDFVAVNTQRYVPKFFSMHKKNKSSWNWAAFIFPNVWLFYRKHYRAAILTTILMIAVSICSIPLFSAMNGILSQLPLGYTNVQMMQAITENMGSIGTFPMALALIGLFSSLMVRITSGIFGDWWYRSHCLATIKEINADDTLEDKAEAFRKKGRVSPGWMLAAWLITSWVPTIINMLVI
ncbi:MAG: RING finger protein [Oscillospiraceae bacterium]